MNKIRWKYVNKTVKRKHRNRNEDFKLINEKEN